MSAALAAAQAQSDTGSWEGVIITALGLAFIAFVMWLLFRSD